MTGDGGEVPREMPREAPREAPREEAPEYRAWRDLHVQLSRAAMSHDAPPTGARAQRAVAGSRFRFPTPP